MRNETVTIPVIDKFGNETTLEAQPGTSISSVLQEAEIPRSAALVWVDGEIGIEAETEVSDDSEIRIQIIRNYDLMQSIWGMEHETRTVKDPVFQREYVEIEAGKTIRQEVQLTREEFRQYLEEKFVQNIQTQSLVESGGKIAIGFSGGTDSTTMLCLFEETRDRLPEFELHPVTIAGVSDGADVDIDYTESVCERYDLVDSHHIVPSSETESVFGMTESFKDVLESVARSTDGMQALYVGHHIIRRMVEHEAAKHGANTLSLGLEKAEFVASLLGMYTTGQPLAGLADRTLGDLRYIYPLHNISKKEVEVYHQFVLQDLINERDLEEYSTINQLAPGDRALYLHITDLLLDAWPGIEDHLYYGFEQLSDRLRGEITHTDCDNCGGIVYQNPDRPTEEVCEVCALLSKHELIVQDPL